MRRRYGELLYSLAAIVVITAIYVLAYRQADRFPVPSSLVGHGIGILGIVLMLMTATLYTIRKRRTDAAWGSMEAWLRFHMVTGLVGPYMVLLHTSMRFRGLAGVTMLLTVVVVISGVIGRYLYTAVPRVVEPGEPDALERLIARYETSGKVSADLAMASVPQRGLPTGVAERVSTSGGATQHRSSDRRAGRVAARRRALAAWRSFHVPLTWALFVAATVHMAGALYYELGR
ncbi:MAG: hypothetical protein ACM3OO_01830 [Planctomycetaceae bacterium]